MWTIWEKLKNNRPGQTIMEFLVAVAVFVIGIVTVGYLVLDAMQASRQGAERTQAGFLASEGLEAARAIRNAKYSNLINGPHGISTSTGIWAFIGTSDAIDGYNRVVTVADYDADSKLITSAVNWNFSPGRTGTVSLSTLLGDWTNPSVVVPPPPQAGCLYIHTNPTDTRNRGSNIMGYVFLDNLCANDITVHRMKVSWATKSMNMNRIRYWTTHLWVGTAANGAIVNLVPDYTLHPGDVNIETDYRFSTDPNPVTFTISYYMLDGSIATSTPFYVP